MEKNYVVNRRVSRTLIGQSEQRAYLSAFGVYGSQQDIIIEGVFQQEDLHVIRLVLLAGFHQATVKSCEQFIDGLVALFQCTDVVYSLPLECLVHIVEIEVLKQFGYHVIFYRSGRIWLAALPDNRP